MTTTTTTFTPREKVLSQLTRALLAGFLVQIGDAIFALREEGEPIDNGEAIFSAFCEGLFIKEPNHKWVLISEGSPRPTLRERLATMTDKEITEIAHRFESYRSLSAEIAEGLETGIRLPEPPQSIF